MAGAAHGQNLTISAKVLDRETKEPLSFASVGIKGKPIGTITNLQGEFDFHFPDGFRQETFVISMLGYQNYEAPLATLLNNPSPEILVEKSNTVLNTVVVSDSLEGGDILRAAISRINQNYPAEPFLMEGFYRDVKQVAGTYISVLEAAIKIYDENYKEPRNKSKLRERVSLQEVRRSIGYANRFTTYFDQIMMCGTGSSPCRKFFSATCAGKLIRITMAGRFLLSPIPVNFFLGFLSTSKLSESFMWNMKTKYPKTSAACGG
jgi:hypothetical protein